MQAASSSQPPAGPEPKPGHWLSNEDFAAIVRLTPLISIDLLLRTPDGQVLVGRRKNEPAKNLFFVPGGRISKNERLAAAFQRIARDELGLELGLEQARFKGAYEHLYDSNRFEQPGYGTHYVVLAYEVALDHRPKTLPLDQHDEYAWLAEPDLLTSPEVHENTKAYFRGLNSRD